MGRPGKEAWRALHQDERQERTRVANATSEWLDAVKRARAMLAVERRATLTNAGEEVSVRRELVAYLVSRFHQRRLAMVECAPRARSQTDLYRLAARREPGRRSAPAGPHGDLVALGAPRVRLPLSTLADLSAYRLCLAQSPR